MLSQHPSPELRFYLRGHVALSPVVRTQLLTRHLVRLCAIARPADQHQIQYGVSTSTDVPEFVTIGDDFSDADRRFREWHQERVEVAGSTAPSVLTLQVTGQLEDDVASWLLRADIGDKVVVCLQDGIEMLRIMAIDSLERSITYNGVLTANIDLTVI